MQRHASKLIESPVGPLKLVASTAGLLAVLWAHEEPTPVQPGEFAASEDNPILLETERQLQQYFAGRRQSFSLPVHFTGTPFQQRVWAALLTIPYGDTRSYGQIARQIGSPAAVRAVGAANGCNPISIIVPCHRVIGSDGTLTGFAGGLATKARLLALEAENCVAQRPAISQLSLPGLALL